MPTPSDAVVTNAVGGLFDTQMNVHYALDALHEAGFPDASFAVIGPEEEQVDMAHGDSDLDNMVEDGQKLRRWGRTPQEWHFQNGAAGITLMTAYQTGGEAALREALRDFDMTEEQAATFASGVDDGLTLLVVHNLQTAKRDRALGILREHGGRTAQ